MSYLWETHLASDVAFDAAYHENPRTEIASFLNEPPGLVLDIGCGGGAMGKLIKEKFPGTRVIGIERNPHAAERARQYVDRVICDDIEKVRIADHLGDAQIGTVLLLDVLEHLYDPWRALLRIRGWLQPSTRVLASVPNVRNLATLDELAAGRWDYRENGVLDISHVRFFTRATLLQLFEETGYSVLAIEPLTQPTRIDNLVIARRPDRLITRNLTIRFCSFSDLEDLYAFQYVVDARIAEGGRIGAVDSPHVKSQRT
ncbi:MAG TPA: class I SAM-dependent methyltransferase [Casimicrobiaceae bacterium]|nr:class I SAM-dependent methyltransferase [Casimicrobiaceae bacterium]